MLRIMLKMLIFSPLFCILSEAATVDLVVVGGSNAVCSGARVTLQCTLTGNILIWKKLDGDINLLRGVHSISSSDNTYQWQLVELDENRLQSSVTFLFNNEITINCTNNAGDSSSITVVTEGPPSAPERPLTALDRIRRLNKTFSSVSVVWNIPDANNAHISSYVVTVYPPIPLPASGVIAADNLLFQTRQLTLTLLHGQQYYITVTARSCGDSVAGPASSALRINVPVPPSVRVCKVVPVYDYFSNNLSRVMISWEPIKNLNENITDDGISANVTSYIISAVPIGISVPEINITLDARNEHLCNNTCHHTFHNTSGMLAVYYSWILSAKNDLLDGYSDIKMCSYIPICVKNDLLSIEMKENCSGEIEILCRILSRYVGEARCEIIYKKNETGQSFTDISHIYGSANDIIPVLLTTSFYPYMIISVQASTVGGKQEVVVEGIFETENMLLFLEKAIVCPNLRDVKAELIVNSTTQENMTPSFCPQNETSFEVECPKATALSTNYLWIMGAVAIVILLFGFVSGILTTLFWQSRKNNGHETSNHFYDYINTPNRDISTVNNKCYVVKATSEL